MTDEKLLEFGSHRPGGFVSLSTPLTRDTCPRKGPQLIPTSELQSFRYQDQGWLAQAASAATGNWPRAFDSEQVHDLSCGRDPVAVLALGRRTLCLRNPAISDHLVTAACRDIRPDAEPARELRVAAMRDLMLRRDPDTREPDDTEQVGEVMNDPLLSGR